MKSYDWSNKNLRVVEWVSCKERMPEEGREVYVKGSDRYGKVAIVSTYSKIDGWSDCVMGCANVESAEITHWFYIPEPPEGPK